MTLEVITHNNKEFKKLLEYLPPVDTKNGPWIAGGCARKLYSGLPWQDGDIDVFFSSQDQFIKWLNDLNKPRLNKPHLFHHVFSHVFSYSICQTDNAITNNVVFNEKEYKVQTIRNSFYESIDDLFANFDFDVCMFAADKNYIVTTPNSVSSVDNKTINKVHNYKEETFVQRVAKYHSYGFHISQDIMLKALTNLEREKIKWEMLY